MKKVRVIGRDMIFAKPAGTSRGVLHSKPSWFISIADIQRGKWGIGECSIIPGLSYDDHHALENTIHQSAIALEKGQALPDLTSWPSVHFAVSTALLSLESDDGVYFDTPFARGEAGIDINGLVWMGTADDMLRQVDSKVEAGYTCVKLKIGALDFNTELSLLAAIREQYPARRITLRVDANGAFAPDEALAKIEKLARFDLHSIEQPIQPKQWKSLATLCSNSPVPIALDEELIPLRNPSEFHQMLDEVQPSFLVLKPGLLGGFPICDRWIALAAERNIGWWITSALESNIGLNAIAQYTASKQPVLPQGLGTGQLFTNNFDSPLDIQRGKLFFRTEFQFNQIPAIGDESI